MRRIERKMGYHLEFKNIPSVWINGWMTYGMRRAWLRRGINANGVNYFTMGSLVDGVSSRFLRDKRQYQSWLGAYMVRFKRKKFKLQSHCDLAVADQKNWLEDFGDIHPFIKMPAKNCTKGKKIKIDGYPATLYEFLGGPSHSDVGHKSGNVHNRIIMGFMSSMFNKCNPKLNLRGSNFIPKDLSFDYETVILRGYIAIIDLDEDTKLVLYGNSAAIHSEDGKEIDYYPLLKKDILAAFRSVSITRL